MVDSVGYGVFTSTYRDDLDPEAASDDHYSALFKMYPDADVTMTYTENWKPGYYAITTEFE